MTLSNTRRHYGSLAKFFHWLIFLLLFCQLTVGYFLDTFPKDLQPVVYNVHKLTGITILFLMVLRGLWALGNPKPLLPLSTRLWEQLAERLVHFLLYFLVIAMPLAGWIGAVSGGRPPHIGSLLLSLPLQPDKAVSTIAFELHGIFAICLIVLICIHVSAAFYHYYFKKDNVLQRMMPGS